MPLNVTTSRASTGKATSLCDLRVVDAEGREPAPNEHGEIICRSPATMIGYWEKPEQTVATIVAGRLWTGDRGYSDEDGFLCVAGRSMEMYIGDGLEFEQVEAFCRERLATYKVPKSWVPRAEPLPRTASGKLEKHRLEVPAETAGA